MKLAKAIVIVYLGIFPILPGCLCQVLGAFGISMHDVAFTSAECVITNSSETMPCHCDEVTSKSVELPPNVEDELAWLNASAHHGEAHSGLLAFDAAFGFRDRAPPARTGDTPQFSRTVSGVFLL